MDGGFIITCLNTWNNELIWGVFPTIDHEQTETKVFLEAVQWAKPKGLTGIYLEGKCLNMIEALNKKHTTVEWTSCNLIKDALDILRTFSSWLSIYVYRDANHIADSLAKFAGPTFMFKLDKWHTWLVIYSYPAR